MKMNILTNYIGEKPIDRIYGGIHKADTRLVLKDGTTYTGKIEKRSIKLEDGTMGYVYFANKKWFNRQGMPIDKPINLFTREIKLEEIK